MTDVAPFSVSRRIAARPQEIFAILTDSSRHVEIDGSGMLRGAIDAATVSGVEDVFAMKMYHEELGDYEMDNTVVEYERDRVIAWEPTHRDDPEAEPWHYRWRYELVPDGDGATVVTESFDPSRSPEQLRRVTKDGTAWIEAMAETLRRLERLCTSKEEDEPSSRAPSSHAPSSHESGGRLLGRLGSAGGKGVVRMVDRFDVTVDDVWSALTDPARLGRWLGDVEGDLRVGGELRARFHASGWEGTGRIEACEPPRRLLVRTRHVNQSDDGFIEVTLTADGDQAGVVWEERGVPLNLLAAYGAGIQIHVEDLADHLAGRDRRDAGPRFDELLASYQEMAASWYASTPEMGVFEASS